MEEVLDKCLRMKSRSLFLADSKPLYLFFPSGLMSLLRGGQWLTSHSAASLPQARITMLCPCMATRGRPAPLAAESCWVGRLTEGGQDGWDRAEEFTNRVLGSSGGPAPI